MIMTGGIRGDGISITQLEYMRHIDKSEMCFDVLAVYNNDQSVIEEYKKSNCNVIVMPSRIKHFFKYVYELCKLIKSNHYKAIHVHGSSTMMGIELTVAKMFSIPVRIAHSRNTYTKHPAIDFLLRPIFNHSYTHALACGKEAGAFLFKNKSFNVFYNGKDFDKFRFNQEVRNEVRNRFDLNNKIVLGFVGTIHEQKNPFFLIDIISKLLNKNKQVVLMIIGSGKMEQEVKQYAKELGCDSAIIFVGKSSEVNNLIQGCDLMLLPSLYEGLPNVVLEWQIAGVPSLVSDKVTTECKQSELVRFLPIDKGADIWVDTILEYGENNGAAVQSKNACKKMLKAGFEINKSCERLRSLYIKGVLTNE